MDTQPAAETEGKSQRILQPEAERDGISGARGQPKLLLPTPWWGTQETPIMAQSRGKGVGREQQDVRSEIPPGPDALAKDTEMDPEEGEMGPLPALLRDCPSIWVSPCFLHSHLPLKAANVPTPLPSSTKVPTDPMPVTEWGDLRGPRRRGGVSAHPPAPPARGDSS